MSDDSMRDRLILPILIPVGALAFILFLALIMSQVLLNVPNAIAIAVATFTAINLLIAFSVLALKPKAGRATMTFVGAIAVVPLVLGAAAAAGVVPLPEEEEHGGAEAATVAIAANNLQFDKQELAIPADTEFTLAFNNQEAQPHNVAILEAQGSANALFRGQIITGPREAEETVEPIPAGEYYFQCDVHPTMNGTVTAAEGGGGEASAEEH
ncbi:MAG TPA: cupredoxin domain-containing protein [Actinomycetota bacterium]|nr:cupredoxin domain-containing protein [Actinomycetota bacterium]